MAAPVLTWQTTEALPLRGIDVSAVFPRPEDLTAERLKDVDFAFVRCAYGNRPDAVAPRYVAALLAAKPSIHVAPYAFLRHGKDLKSEVHLQVDAIAQGLSAWGEQTWVGNSKINYPQASLTSWRLWFDLEDNAQNDGPFNLERAMRIWSEVISTVTRDVLMDPSGERRAGIYTAPGWFRAQFAAPPALWRALPYWLAHWGPVSAVRPSPLVWGDGTRARIAAWQFGLVDLGQLRVDGNVASPAIFRTEPPPAPEPTAAGLLEQLAAELHEARGALAEAAKLLNTLPAHDPARLHVARALAALRRADP